jgi:hypothetical protein
MTGALGRRAPGPSGIAVCLETGGRRVFASALDWPGWSRSGRDEQAALAALAAYAGRFGAAVRTAGVDGPDPGATLTITERVAGSATTDFGAPGTPASAEHDPLDRTGALRVCALVQAAWSAFDAAAAGAPASLRKGPRGGGRDTAAIVAHQHDAEVAYARKLGVRGPAPAVTGPGGPERWRRVLLDVIVDAVQVPAVPGRGRWPPRYAARRIAWHALDHAWEIEDRSQDP